MRQHSSAHNLCVVARVDLLYIVSVETTGEWMSAACKRFLVVVGTAHFNHIINAQYYASEPGYSSSV